MEQEKLEAIKMEKQIMKERRQIKFYFLLLIFLNSCAKEKDLDFVVQNMWQYEEGFKVGQGDFLEFGENEVYKIIGDTIYLKGKPRSIIINVDKRMNILTVSDLSGKSEGFYINVEEFIK